MTVDKLQLREDGLKLRMEDLKKSVDSLSEQLADAVSPDEAFSLAKQIGETKQAIQLNEDILAQVREAHKAEQARKQSPEYKQTLKDMDKIKADNRKRLKDIDKTFQELQEQLAEFYSQCQDYDRLKRQHTGKPEPYGLLPSYSWIVYLKTEVDKITNDYIYQTRKV